MSRATEYNKVPSSNHLHSLLRLFGESFTYIKNKKGPRMEPCRTPALICRPMQHARKTFEISRNNP